MPSPDPMPTFASNLRRLRKERGLSQERLAHSADLHMTHVSKMERCEREPGVRTVAKLAKALKVSAGELFAGIDGREPSSPERPHSAAPSGPPAQPGAPGAHAPGASTDR